MVTPRYSNGPDYNTGIRLGKLRLGYILFIGIFLLTGCAFPGSTRPVIKIGFVAPFEGELRPHGYQRLYGVKLALQEANISGGIAGYSIELVALNDYADTSEAILQAQELVIDSDVRGIIGQWDADLYEASMAVYEPAFLTVVDPTQATDESVLPASFTTDYQKISGSLPNIEAKQAYLATKYLLTVIEAAVETAGKPEREYILQTFNSAE